MACSEMIHVEDLEVVYEGSQKPAVEGVNLDLQPGELKTLTGPNGGGKTTILRAITGLIPSFYPGRVKGRIEIDGCDPRECDPREKVFLLLQDPKIQVTGATVFLEASSPLVLRGVDRKTIMERVWEQLHVYGLLDYKWTHVYMLSSGLLQRTALAAAGVLRSRYLLLDEPSSFLDRSARTVLYSILDRLRGEGVGVLVATHDVKLAELADESYIVIRGVNKGIYRINKHHLNPPRQGGELVLKLEKVSAGYPGSRQLVIHDISLQARKSELVLLQGPNGGGKTTILYTIAGFLKPMKGRIIIKGRPRLLPADPFLVFPRGRLSDIIDDPGRISFTEKINEIYDKPIYSLSGGELRLAALAIVLSSGGDILLLDEPTAGLDPENKWLVIEAIHKLARAGYTIVAASHDEELSEIATRSYLVVEGRIRECYGIC
ncbi:MAG: ATP-binding cassette domain-containing protein [Desulfurococcales archaeon]|nr:ATP-binding cassette domain-containing protein [Desulfurococcales archaeon]